MRISDFCPLPKQTVAHPNTEKGPYAGKEMGYVWNPECMRFVGINPTSISTSPNEERNEFPLLVLV
jgi:hypothetical protein